MLSWVERARREKHGHGGSFNRNFWPVEKTNDDNDEEEEPEEETED